MPFLLACLLFFGAEAHAVDCPWQSEGIQTVSATMTSVTVNGVRYPVVGSTNKTTFMAILLACGEEDAAKEFQTWRSMRAAVNATAISVFGLFYTPFAAMAAGMYRDQMIMALYDVGDTSSPAIITGQADR